MKKIISILAIFGLLLVGCGNQPKSINYLINWDPNKDVLPKKNGKLDGLVKKFNGRGQLIRTTSYKNGLMDGLDTHYYAKNRNVISRTFMYKDGRKNGPSTENAFLKDRKTIYSFTKVNYINDKREGVVKGWSTKNGKLIYEAYYKNDKLNGIAKSWNKKDGKLRTVSTYKDGLLNGPKKIYNDDGSFYGTRMYKNNLPGKFIPSARTKRADERSRRADIEYDKKLAKQKKKAKKYSSTSSSSKISSRGITRITGNDGKFINGVCANGNSFFIESKGLMFEGSGSRVCTKADLKSTISCVCSSL